MDGRYLGPGVRVGSVCEKELDNVRTSVLGSDVEGGVGVTGGLVGVGAVLEQQQGHVAAARERRQMQWCLVVLQQSHK